MQTIVKKITNNALIVAAAAAPLEISLFWHLQLEQIKKQIIIVISYKK